MRIGLVGCVKEKGSFPAPARDLYISSLFRGRRRFVEQTCDRWYILSAKHGLLRPTDVIEPYDETLDTAPRSVRRAWADSVLRQLATEVDEVNGCTFEVHAGMAYRDYGLVAGLLQQGGEVDIPAEGLTQGRQLAFYSDPGGSTPARTSSPRRQPSPSEGPLTAWLRAATPPVTLTFTEVERMRHIPLGTEHKRRPVTLLVAGRHVRIVAEDGALLRERTLDPQRDYQPLGRPPGPSKLGHHDVRQVATIT